MRSEQQATPLIGYLHEQARGIVVALLNAVRLRWEPAEITAILAETEQVLAGEPLPDLWGTALTALKDALARGDVPDDALLARIASAAGWSSEQLAQLFGSGRPVPPTSAPRYAERYVEARRWQQLRAWASDLYSATGNLDAPRIERLLAERPLNGAMPPCTPRLQPHTPAELRQLSDATIDWLWQGIIPAGGLVLLAGREKGRGGKSTLTFGLIAHLLRGEPFLERATQPVPVLYLSEEPRTAIAMKLEAFGIRDARLLLLSREDFPTGTRGALTRFQRDLEALVVQHAIRLVVVDTLQSFAEIRGEGENVVGTMLDAIAPLQTLAAREVSVLVLHHHSKGAGEPRGSTALTAAVDVVVNLTRVQGDHSPNRRVLEVEGRYGIDTLLFEYDPLMHTFVSLGSPEEVEAHTVQAKVRQLLAMAEQPLTQSEIAAQTGVPQPRVAEALSHLMAQGVIQREGEGKRSNPYRYSIVSISIDPEMTIKTNSEYESGVVTTPFLSPIESGDSFLSSCKGMGDKNQMETPARFGRRNSPACCPTCAATFLYRETDGFYCYNCRKRVYFEINKDGGIER